jgi:hypothetical protein
MASKTPPATVSEGYRAWLSQFAWDWFGTLTFDGPIHPEQAAKRWSRWLRLLESRGGREIRWVRASEYQQRGVLHFHCLLAEVGSTACMAAKTEWERIGGGHARIVHYDPRLNGIGYLAKGANRGGEIDCGGGTWPQPRALGGGLNGSGGGCSPVTFSEATISSAHEQGSHRPETRSVTPLDAWMGLSRPLLNLAERGGRASYPSVHSNARGYRHSGPLRGDRS